MAANEQKILLFEEPGPGNTEMCVEMVRAHLGRGFRQVVVASTSADSTRPC